MEWVLGSPHCFLFEEGMVSSVHTDSSSLSQKLETWPQGRKAVIGAQRLTGGFTGSNGVSHGGPPTGMSQKRNDVS